MAPDLISVLLIGDSHVIGYQQQQCEVKLPSSQQLRVAIKPVHIGGAYAALDAVVTFPDGRTGLNPVLEQPLSSWPGLDRKGDPEPPIKTVTKHVVLSLGSGLSAYDPVIGMDDIASSRLILRPDVDFVLPERLDLSPDPSCMLVPVALMREMFESMLEPLKKAVGFLKADYQQRIWIIGCPPPSPDNATTQKTLDARAKKASPPYTVTLAAPTVRLKAWLLVVKSLQAMCEETGCKYIDCSAVACDANGFLRSEFEYDGIHGNAHYNQKMARQIISAVVGAELVT